MDFTDCDIITSGGYCMKLGTRLKRLIEGRELTQREFGKLMGWAESTVSNYIKDERQPSLEALQAMADFFGVTVDYLIGRSDDPKGYGKTNWPDAWEPVVEVLKKAGLSPDDVEHAVGVLKELKKIREG